MKAVIVKSIVEHDFYSKILYFSVYSWTSQLLFILLFKIQIDDLFDEKII